MTEYAKTIELHNIAIMKLAKKSVVVDLLHEFAMNNYTTPAQFNGALQNKLEELNDEQD